MDFVCLGGGFNEGRYSLPLASLEMRVDADLDLFPDFLRQLARLRQTDFLATAKTEVSAYTVLLDPAHPAAGASRPIEPDESVAKADPALFALGLREPVRSAFHPLNHKI